ncbi:MAG TPA: hypothetical protein VEI97_11325, partial [bacterium]|nr:hypothetical protein [bacterium]
MLPPFPDLITYTLRALAAALSGTLLFTALATQQPLWWLIFVALVPLEWAIRKVRPLEALAYGFVTFFVFLTVNLWWLAKWGWGSVMGLTFMEAMAYAIAVGFYTWIRRRLGADPWHLLLPACLIIVEWKRNIGLWAFPWPMLGHSLVYQPVLLQSAAIVGVLGLSFIVVWANATIASLFLDEVRPPQARWR